MSAFSFPAAITAGFVAKELCGGLHWSGECGGGRPGRGWLLVLTRRALEDCWVIYELWHNFSLTDIGGKEHRKRKGELTT